MTTTTPDLETRRFWTFNGVVSAAALAFLTYILVVRKVSPTAAADLSFLPAVNASLNATAAVLLVLGWAAIRRGRRDQHPYYMVGAFVASSLFLVSYLVYHWVHGDTKYVGAHRGLYLGLLASHVLLSVPVVPLCLAAFYFAYRKRFSTHRKITRVLAPVWLYVSVTGVLVFFFLRR